MCTAQLASALAQLLAAPRRPLRRRVGESTRFDTQFPLNHLPRLRPAARGHVLLDGLDEARALVDWRPAAHAELVVAAAEDRVGAVPRPLTLLLLVEDATRRVLEVSKSFKKFQKVSNGQSAFKKPTRLKPKSFKKFQKSFTFSSKCL